LGIDMKIRDGGNVGRGEKLEENRENATKKDYKWKCHGQKEKRKREELPGE
jgi:hypothetical protein